MKIYIYFSMFHVKHYLFISAFIINYIFFFLLYNYFPGNFSMFHVKHYLFIFDFIINYISFFLLYNYFPGNISMFHVKHYLFIFAFIINNISFFLLCYYFPGNISMFHVKHYLFISVLLSTTSFSFYFIIISREIFLCSTWNIIYLSPFYYQLHIFLFTLILFPGKYFYVPRETLSIYLRFIINNISFFLLCYYFPGNISMFHVEHYLFISVLLSTTSFSFYFNIISREIILYIKKRL